MTFDDAEGAWKPYKPPAKDKERLKQLDKELMELQDKQEEARDKYHSAIPSEPMEIGDETFVKGVIAHVRNFKVGKEQEVSKIRQVVSQITEFSDLTLQKPIKETNKDPETSNLRQTIIDKEWELLPPEYLNIRTS